ncbi:MAG: hypothetical protein KKB50_18435, partial [Planctomycetes bacterium]|nr:hypothetical protein [Planctomycetota bacterium]
WFGRQHGQHLRPLFRDVLGVAVRAGLVGWDHMPLAGTKLEADAGKNCSVNSAFHPPRVRRKPHENSDGRRNCETLH